MDSPELWLARIKSFETSHWEDVKAERLPYREALELKFNGRWSGSQGVHAVNYSYRYVAWFQSQVTGDDLVIQNSREADGDEITGEMADLLLKRVSEEGRAFHQLRHIVPDLGWLGCGAIWYGFHAQHVSRDLARSAGRSGMEISERAKGGDMAPRPGEDHRTAADVLDGALEQSADPFEAASLAGAASAQDAAAEAVSAEQREVYLTDHKVWFRRGRVGIDTFWSNEVIDHDDIWWMAHRVCYMPEVAQNLPTLKPSLRRQLKGRVLAQPDNSRNRGTVVGSNVTGAEDENKRVELFYIWDKRTRTRHIICPELPDKFLETDSSNPYVDEEGRELIPDFFPCQIFCAILPPSDEPTRTLGTPMIAPGWPQQMEANELRTLSLAQARRHSARHYALNPKLSQAEANNIKALLKSGQDGLVFECPASMIDQSPKDLVHPITFGHSNGEITQQTLMVENDWVKVMGMPNAELTSMATADTATQEQIGISAGHNQAEDVIKQIEDQTARMMMGVRGLVRGFYPVERIAALVGPKYAMPRKDAAGQQMPSILETWDKSSLDGDTIRVRFGIRAKNESAVRTNQIMQAVEVVRASLEPTTGLPRFEDKQLIDELMRSLGVGKAQEVDPALAQLRNMVVMLMQQVKTMQEAAQAAPSPGKGSSSGGGADAPGRSGQAPTSANLEAGARRGTVSASA